MGNDVIKDKNDIGRFLAAILTDELVPAKDGKAHALANLLSLHGAPFRNSPPAANLTGGALQ